MMDYAPKSAAAAGRRARDLGAPAERAWREVAFDLWDVEAVAWAIARDVSMPEPRGWREVAEFAQRRLREREGAVERVAARLGIDWRCVDVLGLGVVRAQVEQRAGVGGVRRCMALSLRTEMASFLVSAT